MQIELDREMALRLQETDQMRQHEVLDQAGEKQVDATKRTETREEKMEEKDIDQNKLSGEEIATDEQGKVYEDMLLEGEGERVQLEGSEDMLDSQESDNSFARAVGVYMPNKTVEMETVEDDKRSLRPRNKEDRNMLEVATERKEAQNAFVNKEVGRKNRKPAMGGPTTKAGNK